MNCLFGDARRLILQLRQFPLHQRGSDIGPARQHLSEFYECRPEPFEGKSELTGKRSGLVRMS